MGQGRSPKRRQVLPRQIPERDRRDRMALTRQPHGATLLSLREASIQKNRHRRRPTVRPPPLAQSETRPLSILRDIPQQSHIGKSLNERPHVSNRTSLSVPWQGPWAAASARRTG